MTEGWNHNVHYYPVVLAAVPRPCQRALDVGCGDGRLVLALAARSRYAIGIDTHAESIERARACSSRIENVEFVHGDFLSHAFEGEEFDMVSAVASLHHMPLEPALARCKELLRPGGRLAVVGLARSRSPHDFAYDAAGAIATRAYRLRRELRPVEAPVTDPTTSYREVRRTAEAILPGCRFRQRVLFRYSLTWTKP